MKLLWNYEIYWRHLGEIIRDSGWHAYLLSWYAHQCLLMQVDQVLLCHQQPIIMLVIALQVILLVKVTLPLLALFQNNPYLFSSISGGSATAAIVRLDLSNNPVWTQGFNFNVFQKMFKIDSSEQNIYITTGGFPLNVVRLSTSNGSIVAQYSL